MKSEQTNLHKLAQVVSAVGHPFVLLPLTLLLAFFDNASPARAFKIVAITVLVTVLPLLLIIHRQVTAEKWTDHDVSAPAERRSFYPIAITVVALSGIAFRFLNFPQPLLIGMLVSLVLLLAAMLINRWSKISLHLIFAAYCAVSLFAVSYWIGAGFVLLAIAVGWSRIVLERHSLAQVLSGMALGATAGIFLLRLINFF